MSPMDAARKKVLLEHLHYASYLISRRSEPYEILCYLCVLKASLNIEIKDLCELIDSDPVQRTKFQFRSKQLKNELPGEVTDILEKMGR